MTLELSKSMQWSNNHACFAMFDPLARFDFPDMFFLTSFETPASFSYITPITIGTGYFYKSR